MSWQWRSGNWWVTHIFVRFSLQGHWETPAWGPELSVLLKSNSHAWPKFAYVWIFGCARVCVCVCFTRWSSTTQASTFGIVLHHKHPTEADSCHLRQMPQSDGTPLCAFLLVWQCVCVLPDSGKGSSTLVFHALYLISSVTNHFWTDVKQLAARKQRSNHDSDVTDSIYFTPESFETLSAAEITELRGCPWTSSVSPILHNA